MIRDCYFAYNFDSAVRRRSVSGGVFSALAKSVLNDEGVVIGAAYDVDLNVRYHIVESERDLSALQGVKYATSLMGREVYEAMDRALDCHRSVLFSGLPCQAAAVRKRYGADSCLLICDLVCFGAPPHSFWRKYVDWLEHRRGEKLLRVDPRDKQNGWGRQTFYRYEWADGTHERKMSTYDPYAQAFYSGIAFKDACFRCPFKSDNSMADITIGDGWGVEALSIPINDIFRGISSVIVRTDNGHRAFANAEVRRFAVSYEQLLKSNKPIEQSATRPEQWMRFLEDVNRMDFSDLIRKYKLKNTRLSVALNRFKSRFGRMIRI